MLGCDKVCAQRVHKFLIGFFAAVAADDGRAAGDNVSVIFVSMRLT